MALAFIDATGALVKVKICSADALATFLSTVGGGCRALKEDFWVQPWIVFLMRANTENCCVDIQLAKVDVAHAKYHQCTPLGTEYHGGGCQPTTSLAQ